MHSFHKVTSCRRGSCLHYTDAQEEKRDCRRGCNGMELDTAFIYNGLGLDNLSDMFLKRDTRNETGHLLDPSPGMEWDRNGVHAN